jgi:hypothetical protein
MSSLTDPFRDRYGEMVGDVWNEPFVGMPD